jgi:hypothetical protein
MRYKPRTKVKQDNQRGAEVMSYLYDEFAKEHPEQTPELRNPDGGADIPSLEDRVEFLPMAAQSEDDNGHKLRLLNKFSSEGSDSAESKSFMHTPISEHILNYRKAVKSPLVDSALAGLGLAGLSYGLGQYFNPIDDDTILAGAAKILKDTKAPITQQTINAAKKAAMSKARRNKLLFAGAVGLLGAAANSWYHYVPGRPETLYKWANTGMRKRAGMLDPNSFMDINEVKASVMDSPMTDGNKFLAMNMLDSINKPMVSSNDIIGAAVNTGVSALGSPIGRYTVAAATNAAIGYGAGSLMGISRPDRLAATMGIGSFVMNSLQPTYAVQ